MIDFTHSRKHPASSLATPAQRPLPHWEQREAAAHPAGTTLKRSFHNVGCVRQGAA